LCVGGPTALRDFCSDGRWSDVLWPQELFSPPDHPSVSEVFGFERLPRAVRGRTLPCGRTAALSDLLALVSLGIYPWMPPSA
jgi:hypothetical protein